MILEERVNSFAQLGKILALFSTDESWKGFETGLTEEEYNHVNQVIKTAHLYNGWFTEENVRFTFKNFSKLLTTENLNNWLTNYRNIDSEKTPKTIALIMAGNIPMVGFHDLLSVLITGNNALIKLSSEDDKLLPEVIGMLMKIQPQFNNNIRFSNNKLADFDAVIATGSNNSSRYFDYYFGKYPNIIRKNRTSVAIIEGNETEKELEGLADDVFQYFGLGCRNISKVFIPKKYDLNNLFKTFFKYKEIINYKKYADNYDYNKAIFLMNGDLITENGFLLLKESKLLHSPLAVLFYEEYENSDKVKNQLNDIKNEIQCIVSKKHIPFGQAQTPKLNDYADGVDTIEFLLNL